VAANPSRGEVDLPFGGGVLTLRCSYGALGKLLPMLFDVPEDLQQRRRRWLGVAQEQFGSEPPPIERMEWHHHLLGACYSQPPELDVVASAIAIMAEEHHPALTAADVVRESPHWADVAAAFSRLAQLFHWRPGQTEEVADTDGPFGALMRLLRMTSPSQRHTASSQNGSGH
jgi:hypothetical protein